MAESKTMDTVLGQAAEADLEFDTIFDCEDELIDTVCGCNEAGIPFTEADLEGDFDDLHNTDRDASAKDFEDTLDTAGDANGAKNVEGTDKVNDVKGSDLDSDKSGEFADLHNEDRNETPKEFEKDGQTPGDAQGAKNPEGVEDPQIKEKDLNENFDIDKILDEDGDFDDLHNTDRDETPKEFEKDLETPGDAQGAKNPEGVEDPQITEKELNEAALLEAAELGLYSIMEAKFNFLPKFKKDENLAKYEKEAEEAEKLLNNNGEASKSEAERITKLILRFLDILQNISGVLSTIGCITIIGIIPHLINRVISMLLNLGQEAMAKAEGGKILTKLRKLEKDTKDAKLKAKYKDMADKLDKRISKIGEDGVNEACASKEEGCAKKEGSEEEVEEKCGDKKESCSCGKKDCPICGKKGKKVKSIDEILDSDDDEDDTVVEPGDGEEGATESASIDIDDFDLLEAASGDTDVFAALGDDEEVADDLKDIHDVDSASGKATDLSYKGSEDEDLIDMVLGEN